MVTITIYIADSNQETAIRVFLDALKVEYKIDETNDTEYLLASPQNADHLQKSISQNEQGKLTKVSLDDTWKIINFRQKYY